MPPAVPAAVPGAVPAAVPPAVSGAVPGAVLGAVLGALLGALLLAGCSAGSGGDTYLLAFEPPFWHAVSVAYPQVEQELRATLEQADRRARLLVLDDPDQAQNPVAALNRHLSRGRYRGVVLTPLLAAAAAELAAAHPELRFVLLTWEGEARTGEGEALTPQGQGAAAGHRRGAALPAIVPPNVTEVRFARAAAYTRAGRLARAHIAAQPHAKAGVVYTPGADALARLDAFRTGFAAAGASRQLLERPLQAASDAAQLRRILARLAGEGVTVVYLEVGGLARDGLETVAREGMAAIVGNWGERPGFEDTLLISVDDDPALALAAGIAAGAGRRVSVPSRVVWGLAADPPPAAGADWYDAVRQLPPEQPK